MLPWNTSVQKENFDVIILMVLANKYILTGHWKRPSNEFVSQHFSEYTKKLISLTLIIPFNGN